MKKLIGTFLSVSLITVLVLSSIAGRADSSAQAQAPPDKGRFVMPFGFDLNTGERLLSFEDEFGDDEDGFSGQSTPPLGQADAEKSWLLEPGTFNQLSAAGQRAALRMNGLLRAPRRQNQIVTPTSDVSIEATPGDNTRVNNPAMDTNFHTHSETSIAVNGNTLIESFNEFEFNGYGLSTDGGNTWSHKRTPDPSGGSNFGDGVVAFGPNGEVYYATLAVVPSGNSSKSFIGVAKSTDNGVTFSTPFDASTTFGNTSDFQDKEWIAVDRNASSAFKGNVYVSWSDFSTPSPNSFISFARSTNGGTTWDPPMALSPQDRTQSVQGSVPVVAPNGDVYVAFIDNHPSIGGIGIMRSTDGGKTFLAERKAVGVTGVGAQTGGGSVRTNSFPSMTVDKSNTIHIVYNAFGGSPLDRSDIFYVRSTDQGLTFSSPLKLNDDNTTTAQFLPSIAATADGTLGVKWWDRRNDPINDSLTDVYMTISNNGGVTFGKNFRVTNHNWFFSPIEIGFAPGYHGDYDGLAADASNFYLSWSDERNGEADAFFSQISAGRDPNAPDFNISTMKTLDAVIAGNTAAFDFNTSATNGFAGMLNLSASPSISGLTYNFTNASVNPGDVAHLTVSTSQGVQPGSYLITATATGGGLTRKSNLRLNVANPARFAGSPLNVSRTSGFTSFQAGIKVESGGTVHVVFDDDSSNVRNSDVFYTRSTDAGRSFSAPTKLSGNSVIAAQSTLALDSLGNPYIVWTGLNPNPANGGFAILLSKSTDHGNTFSSPVVASGTSRNAQSAKMVVDKNGAVIVAYRDFATSGSPIFAVRSTDGGTTFSPPFRVSQSGETIGNPAFVAVDSAAAAYVVYQDNSQSVIAIKMAVASDGQNFALPKVVSDPQVSAFAPQIAIDKSDNVLITFYDRFAPTSSSFNREIVVIKSTDHGATFGPQVNVSNNSGQSTFPSLIVGAQGQLSVAWEDTTDDPQRDVMVARSTDGGATWGPPINLSVDPGVSFGAFGGADANGNLLIAWTDDSGANTDVFVASLSPSSLGPPDFSMGTSSAALSVQRGTRVNIPVTINRIAGFSGNVTVTPPDLAGLKAKGIDFSQTSSGGVLSFKLKGSGVTGPQYLTFTGRDDSGRTRLSVLVMIIQPAT